MQCLGSQNSFWDLLWNINVNCLNSFDFLSRSFIENIKSDCGTNPGTKGYQRVLGSFSRYFFFRIFSGIHFTICHVLNSLVHSWWSFHVIFFMKLFIQKNRDFNFHWPQILCGLFRTKLKNVSLDNSKAVSEWKLNKNRVFGDSRVSKYGSHMFKLRIYFFNSLEIGIFKKRTIPDYYSIIILFLM